jgi:hypothetical protein
MTPGQVDELGDEDFAAMVRLMQAEAEEIARANRKS